MPENYYWLFNLAFKPFLVNPFKLAFQVMSTSRIRKRISLIMPGIIAFGLRLVTKGRVYSGPGLVDLESHRIRPTVRITFFVVNVKDKRIN